MQTVFDDQDIVNNRAHVWNSKGHTRFSILTMGGAGSLVITLIILPAFGSRTLIQELIFVFIMLGLAQLWNVLAGWGGLISVGQQAFLGVGAYVLFAPTVLEAYNPLIAVMLAGLSGGLAAALVAPLVFRLEGPYFAVGTWVLAEVFRLLCAQLKPLGGGSGMSLPSQGISRFAGLETVQSLFDVRAGAARDIIVYWQALGAVVLIIALSYLFVLSRHGLALIAVRDSEVAARSVGVEARRIKWWLWIVVGFATGIIGAIAYLQKGRISPDAAFNVVDWSAYVLFVVVIGGIRTVEGPIVGVLVLWFLQSNLAQYGSLYLLALGLLAIGMMLFAPRGIWGMVAERFDVHLFPIGRTLVRNDPVATKCSNEVASASAPVRQANKTGNRN